MAELTGEVCMPLLRPCGSVYWNYIVRSSALAEDTGRTLVLRSKRVTWKLLRSKLLSSASSLGTGYADWSTLCSTQPVSAEMSQKVAAAVHRLDPHRLPLHPQGLGSTHCSGLNAVMSLEGGFAAQHMHSSIHASHCCLADALELHDRTTSSNLQLVVTRWLGKALHVALCLHASSHLPV